MTDDDTDHERHGPNLDEKPFDIGAVVLWIQGRAGGPGLLTEANLAKTIRYFVENPERKEKFKEENFTDFLFSIADALDHPLATTKLFIGYAKAGSPETNIERHMREERECDIAYDLFSNFVQHGKIESSVAYVMSDRGLSRATVFKILKRAAILDREQRTIETGEICYSDDPESRAFEIWLDRYATGRKRKVV